MGLEEQPTVKTVRLTCAAHLRLNYLGCQVQIFSKKKKKEESGTVPFKLSLNAGGLEAKMIEKKTRRTTQTTLFIVCICGTTIAGPTLRLISPQSSTDYDLKFFFFLLNFTEEQCVCVCVWLQTSCKYSSLSI